MPRRLHRIFLPKTVDPHNNSVFFLKLILIAKRSFREKRSSLQNNSHASEYNCAIWSNVILWVLSDINTTEPKLATVSKILTHHITLGTVARLFRKKHQESDIERDR